MPKVLFVRKSGNVKTGPIPVSYTERDSCPAHCPLKQDGSCYAEAGFYTRMAWSRAASASDWAALCDNVRALPEGQPWRHNVAGDLPHHNGRIDVDALVQLTDANNGKRGYTYTHHGLEAGKVSSVTASHNVNALRLANASGFTVNASCDSIEQADRARAMGLPAVVVVESDAPAKSTSPAGNPIAVCPAQLSDKVTCATCRLCRTPDRPVIVAFRAHGNRAAKVNARVKGQ